MKGSQVNISDPKNINDSGIILETESSVQKIQKRAFSPQKN